MPEVVLDYPDAVRAIHQEFVDAGSDVVQAFTVSFTMLSPDWETYSVHFVIADLVQYLKSHSELIIAEGYLFEFIRRGRVRAGSNVPEVVIDYPDHVRALSQEFVDAGSDVVQAFTVSQKIMFLCAYHWLTPAQRYISSSLCSRFFCREPW